MRAVYDHDKLADGRRAMLITRLSAASRAYGMSIAQVLIDIETDEQVASDHLPEGTGADEPAKLL